MRNTKSVFATAAALLAVSPAFAQTHWHITGTYSEACSCNVPCTCTFGESPSPHAFCYGFTGMTIKHGNYGNVRLDGLRLACVNGANGFAFYYDKSATSEQADALRQIGNMMWTKALKSNGVTDVSKPPEGMALLGMNPASIEHSFDSKANHVSIVGLGSFDADYIMGFDGKTPITMENNAAINIKHDIKGKTRSVKYKDSYGNELDLKGSNSDQGTFDWTDETPVYFK